MVRLAANLLLLLAFGTHAAADPIVIGSGGEGSSLFAYSKAIVEEAERIDPHATMEARATGGSFDNLKRLASGEINVALVTLESLRTGTVPEGTSALWAWDSFPVVLFVRKSLGISRISELKGNRIIPGGAGSGLERIVPHVYGKLGAKVEWKRASWDQIGYMLGSNQADGFVGSMTTLETVKSQYGMPDLVPVRLSPTEISLLESTHGDISLSIVMHEGHPVSGWTIRSAFVARNIPDADAETLARAALIVSQSPKFHGRGRPYPLEGAVAGEKVRNHPASLNLLSSQPQ